MKYIRERLSAKLFLANLIVVLIGVVILAITFQTTIPAAFNRHMGMMAESGMEMMGQGQGRGYGRTLFENFRAGMFESLGYAVTASVLAALLVSLFLSRRIVALVRALTAASQPIADDIMTNALQCMALIRLHNSPQASIKVIWKGWLMTYPVHARGFQSNSS